MVRVDMWTCGNCCHKGASMPLVTIYPHIHVRYYRHHQLNRLSYLLATTKNNNNNVLCGLRVRVFTCWELWWPVPGAGCHLHCYLNEIMGIFPLIAIISLSFSSFLLFFIFHLKRVALHYIA